MSRHVMVENFVSRDVSLFRGELVIMLVDSERPPLPETHSVSRLVFVKTRHGRKARVPLRLLSRDPVVFNCPLCDTEPVSSYTEHVRHLVHKHLDAELRKCLDNQGVGGGPSCPFPGCAGRAWPCMDTLLTHYASDHHVLDKVMMYETEVAAVKVRTQETRKPLHYQLIKSN